MNDLIFVSELFIQTSLAANESMPHGNNAVSENRSVASKC